MDLKKRVVALDVGDKRIGIAVSDPFGWTAQGIESYQRKTIEKDYEHMLEILKQYEPLTLLVGLPINMNGSFGPQAKKIEGFTNEFCSFLEGKLEFELEYSDERLTTAAAERILIEADMSRAKRRKIIDKMAAVQILQSYLSTKY